MSIGVRMTYSAKSSHLIHNLERSYAKMVNHQLQLSTGKKIHRPSDDPINVTNSLRIRTKESQNEQFMRNIEDGRAKLMTNDTTVLATVNHLQRGRELAVQGRSDTLSSQERSHLAHEVVQLLNSVLQNANTRFKGEYIFNGTQTKTPPYDLRQIIEDEVVLDPANIGSPVALGQNLVPPTSRIIPLSLRVTDSTGAITYTAGVDYDIDHITGEFTALAGGALDIGSPTDVLISYNSIQNSMYTSDEQIVRQISEDTKMAVNLSASRVFENRATGEDIFRTLITLAEGLIENDSNQIGTAIDLVDRSRGRLLEAAAENGAKINVFDEAVLDIRKQNLDIATLKSEFEDIDFAKVISEFHMQQNLFQASMTAAGNIIQPFLGNYL